MPSSSVRRCDSCDSCVVKKDNEMERAAILLMSMAEESNCQTLVLTQASSASTSPTNRDASTCTPTKPSVSASTTPTTTYLDPTTSVTIDGCSSTLTSKPSTATSGEDFVTTSNKDSDVLTPAKTPAELLEDSVTESTKEVTESGDAAENNQTPQTPNGDTKEATESSSPLQASGQSCSLSQDPSTSPESSGYSETQSGTPSATDVSIFTPTECCVTSPESDRTRSLLTSSCSFSSQSSPAANAPSTTLDQTVTDKSTSTQDVTLSVPSELTDVQAASALSMAATLADTPIGVVQGAENADFSLFVMNEAENLNSSSTQVEEIIAEQVEVQTDETPKVFCGTKDSPDPPKSSPNTPNDDGDPHANKITGQTETIDFDNTGCCGYENVAQTMETELNAEGALTQQPTPPETYNPAHFKANTTQIYMLISPQGLSKDTELVNSKSTWLLKSESESCDVGSESPQQISLSKMSPISHEIPTNIESYQENEDRYIQSQQMPQSFWMYRKQNTAAAAAPPMGTCIGVGSTYRKSQDTQLVIPRYSALPRTISMLVNTSSGDCSSNSNSDSECVSLVDSLEDKTSPCHKKSNKHDKKPVRGDIEYLLPDHSSPKPTNKVAQKEKAKVFFIPIAGDETTEKNVSQSMPHRLKEKLSKRHQLMELKKQKKQEEEKEEFIHNSANHETMRKQSKTTATHKVNKKIGMLPKEVNSLQLIGNDQHAEKNVTATQQKSQVPSNVLLEQSQNTNTTAYIPVIKKSKGNTNLKTIPKSRKKYNKKPDRESFSEKVSPTSKELVSSPPIQSTVKHAENGKINDSEKSEKSTEDQSSSRNHRTQQHISNKTTKNVGPPESKSAENSVSSAHNTKSSSKSEKQNEAGFNETNEPAVEPTSRNTIESNSSTEELNTTSPEANDIHKIHDKKDSLTPTNSPKQRHRSCIPIMRSRHNSQMPASDKATPTPQPSAEPKEMTTTKASHLPVRNLPRPLQQSPPIRRSTNLLSAKFQQRFEVIPEERSASLESSTEDQGRIDRSRRGSMPAGKLLKNNSQHTVTSHNCVNLDKSQNGSFSSRYKRNSIHNPGGNLSNSNIYDSGYGDSYNSKTDKCNDEENGDNAEKLSRQRRKRYGKKRLTVNTNTDENVNTNLNNGNGQTVDSNKIDYQIERINDGDNRNNNEPGYLTSKSELCVTDTTYKDKNGNMSTGNKVTQLMTLSDEDKKVDSNKPSQQLKDKNPWQPYKGKAALAPHSEENDLLALSRGWLNFYLLKDSQGTPDDSNTEDGVNASDKEERLRRRPCPPPLKTVNVVGAEDNRVRQYIVPFHGNTNSLQPVTALPELQNGYTNTRRQSLISVEKLPVALPESIPNSPATDSDHSTTYLRLPSPKSPRPRTSYLLDGSGELACSESSSGSSPSDGESDCGGNPATLPVRWPLRPQRRGSKSRPRSRLQHVRTEVVQYPLQQPYHPGGGGSGWTVTVASNNHPQQQPQDVEMRLSFPTCARHQAASQSDSGLGEDNTNGHNGEDKSKKTLSETSQHFLPPTQPPTSTQWTFTLKNQNKSAVEKYPDQQKSLRKSYQCLPDLGYHQGQNKNATKATKRPGTGLPVTSTNEDTRKITAHRRLSLLWPKVQTLIESKVIICKTSRQFSREVKSVSQLLENPDGHVVLKSGLTITGNAITPEKKPRVPTMSERDLTRGATARR